MAKSGGRKRAGSEAEPVVRPEENVADRALPVSQDDNDARPVANVRLSFRLNPELKALIERAAAYSGRTVSSFAISTLAESARQVVHDHHVTILSLRDWEQFLDLLDNPPEPNAALQRAARRYRELVVDRTLSSLEDGAG